jgi:hypothetical protein
MPNLKRIFEKSAPRGFPLPAQLRSLPRPLLKKEKVGVTRKEKEKDERRL